MSNNRTELYNPNYKIGIKELTLKQLSEGLPNYDVLVDKVKKIREESKKVDRVYLERNSFETLKYDNIFSILGGRGAGKTSILFTLYKNLKNDERNIMVPIVMPELLDKNENIISWILSAIETCLDDIEDKLIEESKYNKDSDWYKKMCEEFEFFDRCVFNKKNKLRKRFNELKQVFYDNENKNFGNNYSESSELMANSVKSGFEIISKFITFWNTLIEVYSQCLIASSNKEPTPLIFLFIDDADLKPDIINELLFVIPKFLSHPNVVVFISGSQKTFALAVKNHMYKSITQNTYDLMSLMDVEHKYNGDSYKSDDNSRIKFSELRYGKEYYLVDKLSDEILRKLFPVYNRFYIKKYDTYEKKQAFQIFKEDVPTCRESIRFSEKITKLLNDYYYSIMKMHYEHIECMSIHDKSEPSIETAREKKNNFKLLKANDDFVGEFENGFYLSFFGRYARDISAVYFALKEMLVSLEDILEKLYSGKYGIEENEIPLKCIESTHSVVIKFLNSAISSNRNLRMFASSVDKMVKTQLLHWQLYIDYSKVLEIFKQSEYLDFNLKNPDPFIEMLCLLNFIEQLIVLMMPQRRRSHGINEIHEFIKSARIKVIQYSDDIDELFNQYYVFDSFNIVPSFDINKIEHQNNYINGIHKLDLLDKYHEYNSLANQEWLELLSNVYFKRYSPFARLAEFSDELLLIKEKVLIDNSYNEMRKKYYHYLRTELSIVNEKNKAFHSVRNQKNIKKNILDPMTENILQLENSIHNIVLYINNISYKQDIREHLELLDFYENKLLKKEVYKLMNLIKSKKVARNDIVRQLNKIQIIIEADTDDYISLHLWYDTFEELLDNNIKVGIVESNETFNGAIKAITMHYEDYVNYYTSIIRYKIATENKTLPIQMSDRKLKDLVTPYIDRLEKREWKELTGLEW